MKLIAAALVLVLLMIVVRSQFFSFAAQRPGDYADLGAPLVLEEHLNGPILAEGVIYGPTGRVTNTFTGRMQGAWQGETGTLEEVFTYSNGNTQIRNWSFTMTGEGRFTGTAPDVAGVATGTVSGGTILLRYTIILPEQAGGHKLNVTDWLYRTENGVIINRSEMRKFGIKVAELVAVMRPQSE